jgi:hypothetical protein
MARIMLAILMLPAGTIVYLLAFFLWSRHRSRYDLDSEFICAGFVTWIVVAAYWTMLWWGTIRWTARRRLWTILAFVAAIICGIIIAILIDLFIGRHEAFALFMASITSPISWLIATVFIWRENADERRDRLGASRTDALVCPTCGYNLTGLESTRCPECGTQFTLNELIASQPNRVDAEIT